MGKAEHTAAVTGGRVAIIVEEGLVEPLKDLLAELRRNKLKVERVKSEKNGGWFRSATAKNPVWYSELCSMYPVVVEPRGGWVKKKPRTIIKRQAILGLLERLIRRRRSTSKYAEYLLDVARERRDYMNLDPEFVDLGAEMERT